MKFVAQIIIPGKPRAKARARKAKDGHFYNPASADEANIRSHLQPVLRDWQAKGPIGVYCRFFFNSNPRTEVIIYELEGGYTKKPDADRCANLILDSLAPWLGDDKVVAQLTAEKVGKDDIRA